MKEYFKKHKLAFIGTGILAVITSALVVFISLVLQYVIDRALEGEVGKAALVSLGFELTFGLFYWLASSRKVRLNARVMQEVRSKIVTRLLGKSFVHFKEHEESDYISLVQNDVKRVEDQYLERFFSCLQAATQLIFAIAVMTWYSPLFTLAMLGMTAAMFVVPAVFSKKLERATEDVSAAQESMSQGLSEVVYGFEVTRSFRKESYRLEKFGVCNERLRKSSQKLESLKALNAVSSTMLGFMMQMVICIMAAYFIFRGRLSTGSMVGVIQVSGSMTQPIFELFALIPAIKSLKPIWEKIDSYTRGKDAPARPEPAGDWQTISLQDVHFSYEPEEGKEVLAGVDLSIEKGKKYLIVGESGSGKTTLVNILAGKMEPGSGRVLIDGEALPAGDTRLTHLSAGVWQDVFLFNESIRDNILMGTESGEMLDSAVEAAALRDVIEEKGLDFQVGTDGDQLSGGQKQRIAIARALKADKDILILDEGLSALHEDMGREIEKRLLSRPEQTVIAISHHVSEEMKSLYDAVIEVKEGKVI